MELAQILVIHAHLLIAMVFLRQYHRRVDALAKFDQTPVNGHTCRFENAFDLAECSHNFPLPPRIDASGIKHMHNHPSFDQLASEREGKEEN